MTLNHLENKCCGLCVHYDLSDFEPMLANSELRSYCRNPRCECHTLPSEATSTTNENGDQSSYSVLREKIQKILSRHSGSQADELREIMSHIDEYREKVAQEVGEDKPDLSQYDGKQLRFWQGFRKGVENSEAIIRRT